MNNQAGNGGDSDTGLSSVQLKAAVMIAEASMPRQRIAEECEISSTCLYNWMKLPAFIKAVAEKVRELDEAVSGLFYANKRNRIASLNEQARDIDTIRRERAEQAIKHPRSILGKAPGAKTGRLVHTKKVIGTGKNALRIDEVAYDKALDASFQSTLEQIAKERGELSNKTELTGANGMPFVAINTILVNVPADYDQDTGDDD